MAIPVGPDRWGGWSDQGADTGPSGPSAGHRWTSEPEPASPSPAGPVALTEALDGRELPEAEAIRVVLDLIRLVAEGRLPGSRCGPGLLSSVAVSPAGALVCEGADEHEAAIDGPGQLPAHGILDLLDSLLAGCPVSGDLARWRLAWMREPGMLEAAAVAAALEPLAAGDLASLARVAATEPAERSRIQPVSEGDSSDRGVGPPSRTRGLRPVGPRAGEGAMPQGPTRRLPAAAWLGLGAALVGLAILFPRPTANATVPSDGPPGVDRAPASAPAGNESAAVARTPSPVSPSPGSPSSSAPVAATPLQDVDWRGIIHALDAARSHAFSSRDPSELRAADAPGSPILVRDLNTLSELTATEAIPVGYRHIVESVTFVGADGDRVELDVTDRRPAYVLRHVGTGRQVRRIPGRGRANWRVTLAVSTGRWLTVDAVRDPAGPGGRPAAELEVTTPIPTRRAPTPTSP